MQALLTFSVPGSPSATVTSTIRNHFESHVFNSFVFYAHIRNTLVNYSERTHSETLHIMIVEGHIMRKSELHRGIHTCWAQWAHALCSSSCRWHTLIVLLPPPIMSLIKDLSSRISLWTFLRSQLLHPWNWRLEWILSPLISFIPHSPAPFIAHC